MLIDDLFFKTKAKHEDMKSHAEYLSALSCGKTVVELGVRRGDGSTVALMHGKPRWMKSYDLNVPRLLDTLSSAAKEAGIDWEFIQGNDLELEIPGSEVLFIDTEHRYAHLRQELEKHGQKTSEFIAIHDTNCPSFDAEGLCRAVGEFVAKGGWLFWSHTSDMMGLTVLISKKAFDQRKNVFGRP